MEQNNYSRKISERQWNQPDKGELESRREATYIDDIIQKNHIERKLLEHLDGIETVFDGGAGSGRFSILLAKQGCRVTHFDISQPMIDKAKELAAREGVLDRITFVKGALEDLGAYKDRSFDLVISFDAPISYTLLRRSGSSSAYPAGWAACRTWRTPSRKTSSSWMNRRTIPLCSGASPTGRTWSAGSASTAKASISCMTTA